MRVKTPSQLLTLKNMLKEEGIESTYYDGCKLQYGDLTIGFISVEDKWNFRQNKDTTTYTTKELQRNFNVIVDSLR